MSDKKEIEYNSVSTDEKIQVELGESIPNKSKFPKPVILIVLNEFCERFAYSGMRAFLALYLKSKLFYSDDGATEIYHIFSMMVYFFPIFGAILADSYLGKYKTILYMMVLYAIGNVILTVTAVPAFEIPGREFTMIGLLLVSLGTGGIKPCVSAFGGDQFKLPEQEKQLTTFFTFFYFIICAGALIAKTVSPLLRSEVHCFGDRDCYSFAFGAPVILILLSILTFMYAKKYFIIKKPKGNIVLEVFKCISKAIKSKLNSKGTPEKCHWLDHAQEHYDRTFIDDVKKTLRIFILFAPLPVFWSLLDQLGSRWTLQASRMDGKFKYFTVKPDQMQVLCPILILIIIPIFRKVVYPFLAKWGILCNSLHKLIAGCILAALAFICSGILELKLEKTYPVLPSEGLGQLRIFNGFNCELIIEDSSINQSVIIKPLDIYEDKFIPVTNEKIIVFNKTMNCHNYSETSFEMLQISENSATSFFYGGSKKILKFEDNNRKSRSGFPLIRLLTNTYDQSKLNITLYNTDKEITEFNTNLTFTKQKEVFSGNYKLYVNSKEFPHNFELKIGGVYALIIEVDEENINANLTTVTDPNSVSMIWVVPQMIIISTGEVLFAIPGLEFAFKEAPESMKSVLQAYWLLIEAFGNLIIIIVTRLGSNYSQVSQFFFFAIMMLISTVIFYIMTRRYENQEKKLAKNDLNHEAECEFFANNVAS